KNYDEAFNVAHAIKGVAGNLALTPLFDEISDMTEHLRQKEDIDYEPLFTKAREQFQSLVDLNAD
ncbi:MAG: Hpt domain-containing protein, partial [Butyrivibrio sp.]|nr:Hpt domain-containing protein [Butyrivibrio sp.]